MSRGSWLCNYKDLPPQFKGRKVGKIFKLTQKDGTVVDAIVKKYIWCNDCEHITGYDNKCGNCKKKPVAKYDYDTCSYKAGSCPVNRWGCGMHFRDVQCSPVCTCDRCY